jgi:DNA invertase Pin-like site-specific DNA recombinase
MKRAALYARVSKLHGQNPQMQVEELRAYCKHRSWDLTAEFVDTVCGAKEQRQELDRLWSACRRREVDAVVVYRYDRFARSLRQLVNALEEFRALGSTSSAYTKGWIRRHRTAASCSASSPRSRSSRGS